MSNYDLPPFTYVDLPADWDRCLTDLRQQKQLAIDIESNSMYVFREEICLVQISTPERDYIIDPLLDLNLAPLGDLLADSEIEKIFHAAEYDLILISRQFGWELNNLFDTMWAARLLGYQRIGLANMLNELFDIELDKKYQRANWGERPLTSDQLRYAQMDTHFLFRLRDRLAEEIGEADLWSEAHETFVQQSRVQLPDTSFQPERFWSLNGVLDLPGQARAIGLSLYTFRHEIADRHNRPLFKILGDAALLRMAEEPPSSIQELQQMKGVSRWLVRRYGRDLLKRIRQAEREQIPKRPRGPRRPPQPILDRYDRLQSWRRDRGKARGVESDVILSRDALWAIAEANPKSLDDLATLKERIGPWRLETYGQEIMDALRNRR